MMCVKYEHAPAGSDGSFTCREQRAMLFFRFVRNDMHMYMYFIHSVIPRDDEKWGDDNDGGAPEND